MHFQVGHAFSLALSQASPCILSSINPFFGSGVLLFPMLLSQQEEREMCDDGGILTFMYATHEVRDPMRIVCVLVYVWMNICGMTA